MWTFILVICGFGLTLLALEALSGYVRGRGRGWPLWARIGLVGLFALAFIIAAWAIGRGVVG